MRSQSILGAIGLLVASLAFPSCSVEQAAEPEELAVTTQAVLNPTWKTVATSEVDTQVTRMKPVTAHSNYQLSRPGTVDLPDEVMINECEDLEGVTFQVPCTLGALSCTCSITTTTCSENAAGTCDCYYTVNPTASNCH